MDLWFVEKFPPPTPSNFPTGQPADPPPQTTRPSARLVTSLRLVHFQRALNAKGYSVWAAKAITLAQRPSSRGLYDDFSRNMQGKTPASPQFLAEYLLFLCHKCHLKCSTLTTYLVALNSLLAVVEDRKMTKDSELQAPVI